MNKFMELRKLPAGSLFSVANILETNDEWKKIMAIVPKDLNSEHFEPKYNSEHMRIIEEHAKATNKKCAEILFDEWGTSGRVRPTLNTLMMLLLKAQAYRAADEIAFLLQESPPVRPNEGPAASIDTNITDLLNEASTKKLSSDIKDNDNSFGEKTTKQMKSVSDFIKFSADTSDNSSDPIHNATTVQVKSQSDLIKFSSQDLNYQEYLDTANIPNFSEIMVKAEDLIKTHNYHVLENTDSSSQVDTSTSNDGKSEIVLNTSTYQTSLPNINLESGPIDSVILEDDNLVHFEYSYLEKITNNFSLTLNKNEHGIVGKIGSGGFGEVFAGSHEKYGLLAIKRSHNNFSSEHKPDIVVKVFNAEVKYLSKFRHKNIVPIIGFSIDGPFLCTVCEYIDGGSLEQKIAEKILSEFQRLNIMLGTAEGLKYLHKNEAEDQSNISTNSNNFIHGDVKSANILLTKDFCPKLCDFGLARQFEATFVMTTPMGTSAYMAPEGFSGTITQKIDIYSYGIVLLELLTGLKAIVSYNNEQLNIKEYVDENINGQINHLLDPVTEWTVAQNIYDLALRCLDLQRKNRPSADEICNALYSLIKPPNS